MVVAPLPTPAPLLVGAGSHPGVASLPTLRQVARRALPQAIEASIVPAGILLVLLERAGRTVAIAAAFGWMVAVTAWRHTTGRRVSGLAVLSITRLLVRSLIAIAAGSTFVYFVQGSIGGFCAAAAFLVSVVVDRPLARRFARDFSELPDAILDHPRVRGALRSISLLWGVVGLAHAATGLWLLVNLPTSAYVVVNTALSVAVPAALIATSVVWFRRALDPTSIPERRIR